MANNRVVEWDVGENTWKVQEDSKSCDVISEQQRKYEEYLRSPKLPFAIKHFSRKAIMGMRKLGIYPEWTDEEIAAFLVIQRWLNPLCSNCKDRKKPLMRCMRCQVVSYCSKECQKADWKRHKKECANENADINPDYIPVFVDTETGEHVKLTDVI